MTCDRKDIVKYLVASGADCNLQDVFGLTAVTIAQKLEHADLLEIMQPNGSTPATELVTTVPEWVTETELFPLVLCIVMHSEVVRLAS